MSFVGHQWILLNESGRGVPVVDTVNQTDFIAALCDMNRNMGNRGLIWTEPSFHAKEKITECEITKLLVLKQMMKD